MISLLTALTAIVVIFYLYLLVRWQYVKRPWCYLMGAAGIIVLLVGRFFAIFQPRGWQITGEIFIILGLIAALEGAIGACYGGKLPIWDSMFPPKSAEEKSAKKTTA